MNMTVIKTDTGMYKCSICGMEYRMSQDAFSCEIDHDIVYVRFFREDLYRLVQYLYTGDRSLLSDRLMETLMKYRVQMKGKV